MENPTRGPSRIFSGLLVAGSSPRRRRSLARARCCQRIRTRRRRRPARVDRAGTAPAFSPRMSHLGLVFEDRIWIMGGQGSDGTFETTSGLPPTASPGRRRRLRPPGRRASYGGRRYQDKMWLVDGSPPVRCLDLDRRGGVDTVAGGPVLAALRPRALVFDGKIWILGGYGGSGAHSTTSGRRRTARRGRQATPAAAWSPRNSFGCVVHAARCG